MAFPNLFRRELNVEINDLTWEELFILCEVKSIIEERYMEKHEKLKEAIEILEEEGYIVIDKLTKERIRKTMPGRKDNLIAYLSHKSDKYGQPYLIGVLEYNDVNSLSEIKIEQLVQYIIDQNLSN